MDRFTIGSTTVRRIVVGPMQNNAYLLDDGQGHALLVDAADEARELLALVGDAPLQTIVTTHRHRDHIQALEELVRRTGATPVCGTPDAQAIEQATGVHSQPVWTGDAVRLGEQQLGVIGLVGHTPGSITIVVEQPDGPTHLFTGDSLFPGGVGKTPDAAAFTSLLDDVVRELFDRFDDDTVVHPGHGEPTTLGAERPHLDEWRERGW